MTLIVVLNAVQAVLILVAIIALHTAAILSGHRQHVRSVTRTAPAGAKARRRAPLPA